MSDNPRCANCFEEIPWTPVYQHGEVYCCDGCVMGGPCVCTYDGPPPKLNTRDILISAGYDPASWAEDLTVCANCFEEFSRPPVYLNGAAYCCRGCTRGGPCTCTYGEEFYIPESEISPDYHDDPDTALTYGDIFEKVNRWWDYVNGSSKAPETDFQGILKGNRLWNAWYGLIETRPDILEKTNRLWKMGSESSEPGGASTDRRDEDLQTTHASINGHDLDAEIEPAPDLESYQVTVSPLPEVADVRGFTAQFETIPSVQSVMLTHYGGDCAIYEMRTAAVHQVIRDLIEANTVPIRNFNLTPDGLELVLRSRTGIEEEEPESDVEILPVPSPAPAHFDGVDELHPFKYEIGVDVFFNGRHQVEIDDVKGPVHMHSWRVQAILVGESINETGSVVGCHEAQEIITDFVSEYHEKLLNKVPPFDEVVPTSNNIARVIYDHTSWQLEGKEASLKSVRLWESPTSYVEYSGDLR